MGKICRGIGEIDPNRKYREWTIVDIAQAKVQILGLIESGMPYARACKKLNISTSLTYKWRDQDKVFDAAITKYTEPKQPDCVAKYGLNGLPRKGDFNEEEATKGKEEFLNGLRLGLPLDYALMNAGAKRTTLKSWMLLDEDFLMEVNKAQAQNLAWWIQQIREGAKTDWRAALAYLERVYPNLFAEVKQVEITSKWSKQDDIIDIAKENKLAEQEQIKNTIKGMTDDELMALAMKSEMRRIGEKKE